ncbi:hypothetical protein [Hymenobacter yonginensis]|uniref:DUF3592 domain-containing protein n=1 Tax=Hymenobacter yonginensis TaxID=748197 RepID=A0ABY7PSM0_9BACT|nr:hypothetical protein [Hymenobacter yonginensis]WBO85884.1 hypothetical protein O9Z63_06445 [Hymenobacter yonginensis]
MVKQRKMSGWLNASWQQRLLMLVFPLALLSMSGVLTYRALRPASSLNVLRGTVEDARVIRDNGRTRPYVTVFKLKNNETLLGIYAGQNDQQAYASLALLKPGNRAVVYFDQEGAKSNGVNLHVYQVKSNEKVVLARLETQNQDGIMAVLMAAMSALFLCAAYLSRRNTASQ